MEYIHYHLDDIAEGNIPLQVGVVGGFSTGKSSFINALLGDELLGVKIQPATAKITKLVYGDELEIFKVFSDESTEVIDLETYQRLSVHEDKGVTSFRDNIKYYLIKYPNDYLHHINLIDTPGFSSISKEDDELTKSYLSNLDVLLWLFDANKVGDKTEIDLINEFGTGEKIYGVINKIDLKPPSVREKLLQELYKLFPFEGCLVFSSKQVCEINQKENELHTVFEDIFQKVSSSLDKDQVFEIKQDRRKLAVAVNGLLYREFQLINNRQKEYLDFQVSLLEKLDELKIQKDDFLFHKMLNDILRINKDLKFFVNKLVQFIDEELTNLKEFQKLIESEWEEAPGSLRKYLKVFLDEVNDHIFDFSKNRLSKYTWFISKDTSKLDMKNNFLLLDENERNKLRLSISDFIKDKLIFLIRNISRFIQTNDLLYFSFSIEDFKLVDEDGVNSTVRKINRSIKIICSQFVNSYSDISMQTAFSETADKYNYDGMLKNIGMMFPGEILCYNIYDCLFDDLRDSYYSRRNVNLNKIDLLNEIRGLLY
ncbi:GTP-binding protein HSR1-related protein [Nitritalea halalkaliphila LW7]|uniref:GTP-binding protein HSR1-related protein n=1 Tax=Nitritalea halalkaliphila LW7 TaxID=1189621 RepID=I5BYD1_9BACT|nr:dynamin family protein [Nitritalea halalkaliphila]EIM74583.1 GTP-binding protein HSR1-related protein [Nitritalea halalkaliphila LW7]